MSSPILTIIIPTFNGAGTLQKTLNSILVQEFREWEVIVVDGGSTDNTVDIIKDSSLRDSRIRFISESDKGIYDAMNKGTALATTEWVYFLGCDDWLLDPHVLQSVFNTPEITHFDLVYGDVIGASYKGRYDGAFTPDKLLCRNISHQAVFYKRSLFDRIGNYNLRYRAHADWDLNIRCFTDKDTRTRYIDLVVAEFGAGGVSASHDVPFLREVLIPEKLKQLAANGIPRLRRIAAYDEWWRTIRNADIRSPEQFAALISGSIPACLRKMVVLQQRVPVRWLRKGVLSKSLMFASYLMHRLNADI